ncbi:hypothetical protein TUM19329_20870 [Legionella antarctica]|uniref:Uncharacterized protein n=1 Tax=Legionella antarctica TaxID=2708020 RepID=A0A6F8T6Y4_9GAMM|nr:hypothetical protein [Legionella antarctica]BCA95726.1 hypothetical protein TUM19329_20870 [Legionella antarctica]
MGKKILFVFSGTGDKAKDVKWSYDQQTFKDDVVRVYFNGCQDFSIGGKTPGVGYLSPNLDVVSSKLRDCFNIKGELSFSKLKRKFGNSIIIEGVNSDDAPVDSINLAGFSRGAVTTFAAARHLDDLNIPIALFAEDPVPGNSKQNAKKKGTEFYKNHDLRDCKNLHQADVILGVYKKNVDPLHNKFYRQMAPLFSEQCNASISTLPKTYHLKFSLKSLNHKVDYLEKSGLIDVIWVRMSGTKLRKNKSYSSIIYS